MHPLVILGLVLVRAARDSSRMHVPSDIDDAINQMRLDDAALRLRCETQRRPANDPDLPFLQARHALVLALTGHVERGTAAIEALVVEQFPVAERLELFSTAIFVWMLANRPDAARDVLEVEQSIVRTHFVFASRKRERYELALAAIEAAEGRLDTVRPFLTRATRPGNLQLHRFMGFLLMACGERAEGRVDAALEHIAKAAAADLWGDASRLLDRWLDRLQPTP